MNLTGRLFFLLTFLVFLCLSTIAQEVSPGLKYKAAGSINDFLVEGQNAYLCTQVGTIEMLNLKTGKAKTLLQIPEMADFMGDPVAAKIYSIDKLGESFLIVTQGEHGFRNLILFENGQTEEIINAAADRMMIRKARFIDESRILLFTVGNEIILFDYQEKRIIYNQRVSSNTFSDFCLDEAKLFVYSTDESGIVHQISVEEGNISKEYSKNNVDNVYRLDFKNGIALTGGQDRRLGVYNTRLSNQFYIQKDFLVYCVGLNNDGSIAAFTANEKNTITLLDLATKEEMSWLKGHRGIVTKIEFIDNKTVVSASEDGYFMLWNIQ